MILEPEEVVLNAFQALDQLFILQHVGLLGFTKFLWNLCGSVAVHVEQRKNLAFLLRKDKLAGLHLKKFPLRVFVLFSGRYGFLNEEFGVVQDLSEIHLPPTTLQHRTFSDFKAQVESSLWVSAKL